MDRRLSSTHIQNKLFWYIIFLQILFYLFSLMSVSVELFLFLCYQDDLEYHCILMPHEAFVGYDQTIANGVGPVSLELVQLKFVPYIIISYLISSCVTAYPTQHPQFCYTNFLNALSFCSLAFCATHHCGTNRRLI
jgi:hypothetical protein